MRLYLFASGGVYDPFVWKNRWVGVGGEQLSFLPFALSSSIVSACLSIRGFQVHRPSAAWRWSSQRHLSTNSLWGRILAEASAASDEEPALASYLAASILRHQSLAKSISFILANKLGNHTLTPVELLHVFNDVLADDDSIIDAIQADLQAVWDRDPACERYIQVMLFFKGFQAVQAYRIAHVLWKRGRRPLALALQSRISDVFHVDIHPAARIGRGVLLDHATGVVIGETAIVGDNVSILHHVTLGGSGTGKGARHPRIGHGVLLGAGVCVLGPVRIGDGSKVGAGSVVVSNIPHHGVAVGIPAKVVRVGAPSDDPMQSMDQVDFFDFGAMI